MADLSHPPVEFTVCWISGPVYDQDGLDGGVIAVVRPLVEENRWRMTGVAVDGDYGTASSDYDGVDQLHRDFQDRRVSLLRLERRPGVVRIESETDRSLEDAKAAAARWLDKHAR